MIARIQHQQEQARWDKLVAVKQRMVDTLKQGDLSVQLLALKVMETCISCQTDADPASSRMVSGYSRNNPSLLNAE